MGVSTMRLRIGAMVAAGMLAIASQAGAAIVYNAKLDGASEAPPNASTGTGTSTVYLDLAAHTLRVTFSFTGLVSPTTVAHIHGPTSTAGAGTAGVMTMTPSFFGFPVGVTSGSYDTTFDTDVAATYNPTFIANFGGGTVAGAEVALAAALAGGKAYLNIHSQDYPGGEIRGFYSEVPLPAAIGPLLLGLLGLVAHSRRRTRTA